MHSEVPLLMYISRTHKDGVNLHSSIHFCFLMYETRLAMTLACLFLSAGRKHLNQNSITHIKAQLILTRLNLLNLSLAFFAV
jgi:hypothetical protein